MLNSKLSVLEELKKGKLSVEEIKENIDRSQSWTSELLNDLEEENLIEKNDKVHIANIYEASLLTSLMEKYDIHKLLSGRNEDLLLSLIHGPEKVKELQRKGFPRSTVYSALKELKETGAVVDSEEGYKIVEEELLNFLKARQSKPFQRVHSAGDEEVIETKKENVEGKETAFSAFKRYGIDYLPNKKYLYRGESTQEIEDVLIHAVLCAKNKKQTAICGVFYLKHRGRMDMEKLWKLASKWNCVERWADLLAFVDRRDVRNSDLFLPWQEFKQMLRNYNVNAEGKFSEENIVRGVEKIGNNLDKEIDLFLLGGANLIMRDLKDSTKDIDIVMEGKDEYLKLTDALKGAGYEERHEMEDVYKDLEPSGIFEKEGSIRWDIFVVEVAGALRLTEGMKERSDIEKNFENLNLHLLSPSDIFLFKAVTDREGDFEDAALLARKGLVDWNEVLKEIKRQENVTERYFSFAVLDTLDNLSEVYNVEVPVHQKLTSYCLERALFITLQKPKTIKELRKELDFPDHQIYNKLDRLEEEGKIEVDREGKLNTYLAKEEV